MKRILVSVLIVLSLSACKKEKSPEPETPVPSPATTGNLYGKVIHFDQYGSQYSSGLNTTTVSLEGKGFKTVTDDKGNYTLKGLSSGTYTIIYEKPGCGKIIKQNYIYTLGDSLIFNVGVSDFPTFVINTAYAKDSTWFSGTLKGIYFGATTNTPNKNASVVAIIGKSQNLDIEKPETYLNYPISSRADTADFNRFFSYSLLKDTYGFKKDSIVYIKVYPVSILSSSYFDTKYNTPVYTSHGEAYGSLFSLYVK
jgi:hypothetical protein